MFTPPDATAVILIFQMFNDSYFDIAHVHCALQIILFPPSCGQRGILPHDHTT